MATQFGGGKTRVLTLLSPGERGSGGAGLDRRPDAAQGCGGRSGTKGGNRRVCRHGARFYPRARRGRRHPEADDTLGRDRLLAWRRGGIRCGRGPRQAGRGPRGRCHPGLSAPGSPRPDSHGRAIEQGRLHWAGQVPPQKWMNFYTKVLAKFVNAGDLTVTLSVSASPKGGVSPQQVEETKAALGELGLPSDVESH